ncbi:MAG TPA: hypothetical protein VE669_08840 [Actinomycetota bacterium]|nr:hypothetical protein [Actinomycetota bacterium]
MSGVFGASSVSGVEAARVRSMRAHPSGRSPRMRAIRGDGAMQVPKATRTGWMFVRMSWEDPDRWRCR